MVDVAASKEKGPELTLSDRKAIYYLLDAKLIGKVLPRGSFSACAELFPCAPRTIARVWKEINERVMEHKANKENDNAQDDTLPDSLFDNRKKSCGRKRKWDREAVKRDIKLIPLKQRRTFRLLEPAIGIPMTTIRRILKEEDILKRHTVRLKPKLNDENMKKRLSYALSQIKITRVTRGPLVFDEQYWVVHVDEKWFYLIKEGAKYILAIDEEAPVLRVANKNSIVKVMFLCAMARPRRIGNTYWDGKKDNCFS